MSATGLTKANEEDFNDFSSYFADAMVNTVADSGDTIKTDGYIDKSVSAEATKFEAKVWVPENNKQQSAAEVSFDTFPRYNALLMNRNVLTRPQ